MASPNSDAALIHAVLEDYESAPIEPRLKTTLAFIQKLTLHPWDVTPEDIAPMREAGVSDAAIEEAISVCACFNIIDRLADAFDFEIPNEHKWIQRILLGPWGYLSSVVPGG